MIVKWVKIVGLQVLLVSLGAAQHRDYEKDFEVFQAGGGDRSQSIYSIYDEEDQRRAHGFGGLTDGFGSESKITYLPYYLSPDRLVRQYRSATEKYGKNDREGSLRSYDEFFGRNFGRDYDKHTATAPFRSNEENEQTEHETEAPRAGPRKSRKGSRKANYKVQNNDDAEQLHDPYDYSYGGGSSYSPSDEYQRIKSLSEQQAKEIEQNPSHCKVVQKEEMECHVCHDPKSGAKSESCSYASKPTAKKYAFVKERKYNSKDDEDEDEEEEEAPKPKKSQSLRAARRRPAKAAKKQPAEETHAALVAAPARQRSTSGRRKKAENRPQRDVIGLDPYLYGGEEEDEEEEEEEQEEEDEQKPQKKKQKNTSFGQLKSYEDYFSHVFPEQHGRKSKEALKSESEYEFLPDYEHKKNVEEVLAEFKTRDWSKCKKSKKGDLTCYECKDPNGVLHEECMFVSESKPRSSRVTYEENKKYAEPEREEQQPEAEEDYEDDGEDSSASEVVTERAAKLRQRKKSTDAAPKPEESLDQKLPKKRTIKRKVTYRKNSDPDRLDKDESRVVYYEQKFTHTEN